MHWRVSGAFVSTAWLLLLYLYNVQGAAASDKYPPLLSLSKELECAATSSIAKELLESYKGINLPGRALPNEWFGTTNSPSLHAESLDIALNALSSTSKRFPELAVDVERIVLQWNYCESLLDNTFYDFTTVADKLEKKIAYSSSSEWEGFHSIGFLGDHKERFVFDSFKLNDAPYVFYEVDYSTYFRKQCLPHPFTSELYFTTETYFPWRVVHDSYKYSENYPYKWQTGCSADSEIPQPALVGSSQDVEAVIPIAVIAEDPAQVADALKAAKNSEVLDLARTEIIVDLEQLAEAVESEEVSEAEKVDEASELPIAVIAEDPAQVAEVWEAVEGGEALELVEAEVIVDPEQLTEAIESEEVSKAEKVDEASELPIAVIAEDPAQVAEALQAEEASEAVEDSKALALAKAEISVDPEQLAEAIESEEVSEAEKVDETSEMPIAVIAEDPAQIAEALQAEEASEAVEDGEVLALAKAEILVDPEQLAETVESEEVSKAEKVDETSELQKSETTPEPTQLAASAIDTVEIELESDLDTVEETEASKRGENIESNTGYVFDSLNESSEFVAEDVTGKSKATDIIQAAQSLETPVPAPPNVKEREHAKVPRLSMYSYELLRPQKSTSVKTEDLGYYHYKQTLRPEKKADGIAEYAFAQAPISLAVQISVNNTDEEAGKSAVDNLPNSSSAPSPPDKPSPPNELIAADSLLGRRWINEKNWRSAGNGYGKVTENNASADSDTRTIGKTPQMSDEDAVTHFPIVIEEDSEAPIIVIEQSPTPELIPNKENKVKNKQKKKNYYGLSGSLTLGNKSFDSDGFSITAGASYKPIKDSYFFLRSSWNYQFNDEEFRYTWGIGYDDWHPGTFAFQLNHWGPLLPGDYLDLENAIASATYKFNKSEFMEKHKLSSSATLSQKISGEPIFSWSNSWSPAGKWFVRSTISQPLKGGETGWSYGFGYANYAPFTFSLEYNNWGFNKAFEDNFKDNGAVSLTYRWRF